MRALSHLVGVSSRATRSNLVRAAHYFGNSERDDFVSLIAQKNGYFRSKILKFRTIFCERRLIHVGNLVQSRSCRRPFAGLIG
jgi:hypothetical protein